MKIECPNCWQHFEVDSADLKHEFACPNCEHVFHGRDALRAPHRPPPCVRYAPWGIALFFALLLALSVALNVLQWNNRQKNAQTPLPQRSDGSAAAAVLIEGLRSRLDKQDEKLEELEKARGEQGKINTVHASELRALQGNAEERKLLDERLKALENLTKKYSLPLFADQLEAHRQRLKKLTEDIALLNGRKN